MRTGATLFYSTSSTTTAYAPLTAPTTIQRSPWHSPVPYLFGGLAAMLGLIAFALLILACSYWKLSTQSNGGDDAEKGESGSDSKASPVFEDKLLVIMAGDLRPTFLATPKSAKKINSCNEEKENEKEESIKENDQTPQVNGETESEQSQQHLSHQ